MSPEKLAAMTSMLSGRSETSVEAMGKRLDAVALFAGQTDTPGPACFLHFPRDKTIDENNNK
jgi:hypothetical protein